ncbi:unnamed protein product [Amoebophrya sp. A25]|nr:unnamed protein product [Amoebophrya sp. A25]|eukprot:GSA25T00025365001.1
MTASKVPVVETAEGLGRIFVPPNAEPLGYTRSEREFYAAQREKITPGEAVTLTEDSMALDEIQQEVEGTFWVDKFLQARKLALELAIEPPVASTRFDNVVGFREVRPTWPTSHLHGLVRMSRKDGTTIARCLISSLL